MNVLSMIGVLKSFFDGNGHQGKLFFFECASCDKVVDAMSKLQAAFESAQGRMKKAIEADGRMEALNIVQPESLRLVDMMSCLFCAASHRRHHVHPHGVVGDMIWDGLSSALSSAYQDLAYYPAQGKHSALGNDLAAEIVSLRGQLRSCRDELEEDMMTLNAARFLDECDRALTYTIIAGREAALHEALNTIMVGIAGLAYGEQVDAKRRGQFGTLLHNILVANGITPTERVEAEARSFCDVRVRFDTPAFRLEGFLMHRNSARALEESERALYELLHEEFLRNRAAQSRDAVPPSPSLEPFVNSQGAGRRP